MKNIELMREYMRLVEAGEKEPWKHFEMKTLGALEWIDLKPRHWFVDEFWEYRLKQKTININGFEVPEPERWEVEYGATYYIASLWCLLKYEKKSWQGSDYDIIQLQRGNIHLTKEAAIQHTEALLSFTTKGED